MVDTNTDRPANNGQDTGPDTISVMEAARRLNVTPDAIRARIRRGTLEAVKRDGAWHVIMPADADDTTQQAARQDTTPATDATGAALVELITDLTRKNAELAGAAAAWQARAGILQERLDAIEARSSVPGPPGSSQGVGDDTTHTGTPVAQATPERGTETATATTPAGGAWERFVRWLRGDPDT